MTGTEKQVKYATDLIDQVIEVLEERNMYNSKPCRNEDFENQRVSEMATRNAVISDLKTLKVSGNAHKIIDRISSIVSMGRIYGLIISKKDESNKNSKWDAFVLDAVEA